jgi:hypothetical protein
MFFLSKQLSESQKVGGLVISFFSQENSFFWEDGKNQEAFANLSGYQNG